MIDTHAHVVTNIDGLDYVILSGSNIADSKNNLLLAQSNPKLLPAVGIHPQEIVDNIDELEALIDESVVAIGECGLEFTDDVDKEKQIIYFKKQIELALKYDKPLIIHSRKAMDETIEILKNYQNARGVIHCYTGGIKRIKKVPEKFYFGIDGNLTYEEGLMEVVKNIPTDRLVLETDSPELTPVPFRGEKNCPENIKYIYQKVAEIWGISFEETEKIIDDNARRLFRLD